MGLGGHEWSECITDDLYCKQFENRLFSLSSAVAWVCVYVFVFLICFNLFMHKECKHHTRSGT